MVCGLLLLAEPLFVDDSRCLGVHTDWCRVSGVKGVRVAVSEFGFDLLIVITGLVGLASIVAMELTPARSPAPLAQAVAARKQELFDWSNRIWWPTPLARGILLGYFVSLGLLAFDVPYSNLLFLLFSLGWSWLSILGAPVILHRVAVPIYELALLLNGAVLALAFTR